MRNPVQARMTSLLSLLLTVIVCRYGRSQVDFGNCTTEAIFCVADDICTACTGELQGILDAGTISTDTDCLTFFGAVCGAVDQDICDVTNEYLVDLAACLAEDQFGCSGFTDTTCAEAIGNTVAPTVTHSSTSIDIETMPPTATTEAPTMMAPTATTEAPTMMAPTVTTEAPTMMAPTATTEAPTMMAPTATTEAPILMDPMASTEAPTTTTDDPTVGEDTEAGSNAGVSISSTTAATTTLMGLALLVVVFVVPGRLL